MNSHTHVSTRWEETVRYLFLLLPQGICHRKFLKHTSDSVILNTRLIVELETQPPLPVKRPKFDLWSVWELYCLLAEVHLSLLSWCRDGPRAQESVWHNPNNWVSVWESRETEKSLLWCISPQDTFTYLILCATLLDVHLFTLEMEEEEFDLWPDLRVLCHDETNSCLWSCTLRCAQTSEVSMIFIFFAYLDKNVFWQLDLKEPFTPKSRIISLITHTRKDILKNYANRSEWNVKYVKCKYKTMKY